MGTQKFDANVLDLDCAAAVRHISERLLHIVANDLHRRGMIIAVSGGVDSSVCAALAAHALGGKKMLALSLPERDSSPASLDLGRRVAEQFDLPYITQDIAATLEAIGCYEWRDQAIRSVFPDYGPGWKNKIVISGGLQGGLNFFKLVVQEPGGQIREKRLPHREYLQIVAAQNYKQRIRKTIEYFHADRLNYAVIGTPNRLEYDQGFFVKNGDGAADVKPIAHLYKTQVYALARYLGLPDEICRSTPTTDTYSMPQGQDEFFFALPYNQMDLALWAHNHNLSVQEAADLLRMDERQAAFVYEDIEAKRRTTRYLHAKSLLVEPVKEITLLG